MIVDCHTHIDCSRENPDTFEHLAAAETVDFCIVSPSPDNRQPQANSLLSKYVLSHKEKMIGLALINPLTDEIGVKALKSMLEKLQLKGAVLHCADSGFHPAHTRAMKFYETAQELSLPVFFYNSHKPSAETVLNYAQPILLDEIARRFPALKIVIGTMGLPFLEQTLAVVAGHKNVYADLTIKPEKPWQVYNTVAAAHEAGLMNKLLFGSGFPFGRADKCIETLLGFNKLLGDTNLPTVPREEIRNVIERNALNVLGIEK